MIDLIGLLVVVVTVLCGILGISGYLADKILDRTKPTLPNPDPKAIVRPRRYW